MARKVRIAAIATLVFAALLLITIGGAYYAARQVRPFYEQALQIEPAALEQGSRELESRATTLYSHAKRVGRWRALFTTEQINGWLATQLVDNAKDALPPNIHDPRIAIEPDVLTLGFRTSSGGVETVISVDAAASVTEQGAVAIQLIAVRAGNLPLPVMQLADELAAASQKLKLPVRWTRQDDKPVALIEIRNEEQMFVDVIQLDAGQIYVAGHTDGRLANADLSASIGESPVVEIEIPNKSEPPPTPKDEEGLEIARRPGARD